MASLFQTVPPFLVPTPSAPRTSSCVYCFKSQKSEAKTSEKKWPNADAFYLLNYIDCVSAGSRRFRGGCVCVCPPDTAVVPSSGVRPRGVWKSIFPRRSCVFFCSGLFSGAHGRHLASKLSSSSSSSPRVLCLAGRFCWPDFLQTKGMCAPRILLVFLRYRYSFRDVYIYSRFSKLFRRRTKMPT